MLKHIQGRHLTLPSPSPHVILILKHIFLITGRFMAVYDSNYHFRKSMLFQKIMKKQEIFVLLRRRTNEYGKKRNSITGRFMAVYDSNYHFRKSMLFQKIMKKQEIFVLLRRRTNEYGKKRNSVWFCIAS